MNNTPPHTTRSRSLAAALLAAMLAASSSVQAASTWNTTTGTWDLTTNWSTSAIPTISDDVIISSAAATITMGTDFANSLTFGNTGAVTLSGGTSLTVGAGGITKSSGSTAAVTISTPVILGAAQTWTNSSATALTVSGVVSGTAGLTTAGTGTTTLSGANTYSGGTTLSAGTLLVGNAAGAGTGTITLNGGTFGASGAQAITNKVQVLTGNSATIGGGTGTLTLNGTLTGGGALQLTTSALVINGANVASTFTGSITSAVEIQNTSGNNVVPGTLNLSNAAITLQTGGGFRWSTGGSTAQTATFALGSLAGTAGTLGLSSGTNKTDSFWIGSLNTNTTFGGTFVNGNGGTPATSLIKVGTGTLILNGAAASNTMTGGVTIRGGTLQIGDGTATAGGFSTASNALTLSDTGTFNYMGSTAGSTQGMAALSFGGGDGTVKSTNNGGTSGLTFASLAARSAGATGNFVVSGGTNGTTNKIVFTAAPTLSTSGIMDKGEFFGGSNYAAYDATNSYVRAYQAGDANYVTATGSNAIANTATDNVALTGNVTAQATASINTLNLGANTLALASGAAFKANGILVSGNNASTISGGTSIGATTSGGELVIRVDGSGDALNISTPILANGTNALTKSGAGTLTISGTGNTNSGTTYVNGGTLLYSGTNTTGGGAYVVSNSGTLTVTGTVTSNQNTTFAMSVGSRAGNGILNVNSGGTLNLLIGNFNTALAISNSNTGADAGSGTVNVAGTLNTNGDITVGLGGTQTGTLNINNGGVVNIGTTTLRYFKIGQFDTVSGIVNVATGGTLNLDFNSDIRFSTSGGAGVSAFNQNGGNVTVWSGNATGTTGSATDGAVVMQDASQAYANNTYNLNGGTLTVNRVYSAFTNGTRTFNFNGGTLKAFSASAATFFDLGTGNSRANVRDGGALIDTNGFNATIAQALLHSNVSGDNATDGGLTKRGTGTLTLTGANTYTGSTTISAGTLALGSAGTIANSPVITVGSAGSTGTVLDLTAKTSGFSFGSGQTVKGIGTINIGSGKTVTMASGSSLTPGNSIGTLSVTGDLVLASGSASVFELGTPGASRGSPGSSDKVAVSGALTLGGDLTLANNAGANGNGTAAGGSYQIFTQTGTASGSFASVTNNVAGTRYVLDAGTSGSVYVDLYNKAAAATSQTINISTRVNVAGSSGVTLANTGNATAPYQETLGTTGFSGTTSGFTASGSATGIAGGTSGSGTLSVGGTFATSGVHSGSATLGLQTEAVNSSGLGNLAIADQTVTINVTAYDLAVASFSQSGGDGSFSGAGTSYTLDFGTNLIAGHTYTATIDLANASGSFRDSLGGAYSTLTGNTGELSTNAGTGSISALAAGSSSSITISFMANAAGSYAGTLSFAGLSKQTGLSDVGLSQIDLSITAGISAIPEPTTYAAIFGTLALAGAAAYRRRKARKA